MTEVDLLTVEVYHQQENDESILVVSQEPCFSRVLTLGSLGCLKGRRQGTLKELCAHVERNSLAPAKITW